MKSSGVPIRKTTRHVVRARGQAVDLDRFALIGDRFLDVSAEGCLVACDDQVRAGQRLMVSFQLPSTGLWFDAEGEVVRVIEGWRNGDPGYAAGVRFVSFERRTRLELGIDLRELPQIAMTRSPTQRLRALAAA
jgi:hypothetical protein